LRARLLDLADRAGDAALGIAVLERHLAADADDTAANGILLELAKRRTDACDFDGAAREPARAAEREARATAVLERPAALEAALREAEGTWSSDGLVSVAETRALVLTVMGPDAAVQASNAWRDVGSLRWDLAEDQEGAEDAFFAACLISPQGGVERY